MRIIRVIRSSKILLTLAALCGISIILLIVFYNHCGSTQQNFKVVNDPLLAEFATAEQNIADYKRSEESTYLTFPEWYLVFNPQEYGTFIAHTTPSNFPYFKSIGQFWGTYCQAYGITKRNYPFNAGDHLTISVIGSSFTVEYTLKGLWENTIGRASGWIATPQSEEDVYAAQVAQEYGNFIPTAPWYDFPFGDKFIGLWADTQIFGPHWIRKIERKVFLSLEYGIKSVYALLIRIGTHAVYGTSDTEIYIAAKNVPQSVFSNPHVKKVKDLGNSSYLLSVPHYQGFTDTIPVLAEQGVTFVDFAGNDEILLTVIAPQNWEAPIQNGTVIFTINTTTNTSKRVGIQAPVRTLHTLLQQLKVEGVAIEHLYDY
jgi:hypothetical protein